MGEKCKKNYGGKALIPILVFLGLYVGSGVFFTIIGVEKPFNVMPRYVAVLAGVLVGMIFYERDEKLEALRGIKFDEIVSLVTKYREHGNNVALELDTRELEQLRDKVIKVTKAIGGI